jgi:Ataxin-3
MDASSPADIWIYHERQEALLCGQHALNNLVQAPVFDAGMLSDIAVSLDAMEQRVMGPSAALTPSANVDAQGNFSIQVLKAALQSMYDLQLPHLATIDKSIDITCLQGFICHKSDHWFAIRCIGGRFWNLNSMVEIPTPISHFRLATELHQWSSSQDGYTIFAIQQGLPPAGGKPAIKAEKSHGAYHRMEDL